MKTKFLIFSLLASAWLIPGYAADTNNSSTSDLSPPPRPLPAPPADKVSPSSDIVPGTAPTPSGKTVGKAIDDATITTRIKARFVRDSSVKARDIKVETSQGVVQLSGFVNNETEKTRAADIAREVPGVREVRNDVIVQAPDGTAHK